MKHSVFFLWMLYATALCAQQGVVTAGGGTSGTTGSVSYSVGQSFYTHHGNQQGSVAEGMQQPYEISVITHLGDLPQRQISCTVYPNPTRDQLLLTIDEPDATRLSYQLFDMNGKVFFQDAVNGHETTIEMAGTLPGVYFLRVSGPHRHITTFRIIKY